MRYELKDWVFSLKTNCSFIYDGQINNLSLPKPPHNICYYIVRQTAQTKTTVQMIFITKLAISVRKSTVTFNLNAFRRDFAAALAGFLRSNCVIDGCWIVLRRDYIFDALTHRSLPMCKTYPSHFLFHSPRCLE